MRLEGKVFRSNIVIADKIIEREETSDSFVKNLESCFVMLCRELDVPIPLWLDKNTKEFAMFHQTMFFAEQFVDEVKFNRFQIRLLK